MGKINKPLKRVFIGFNSMFAISSIDMPSLGWMWVFAIGVLGVSSLGICAASSEKVLMLKVFAGLMGIGMITMMIFGIITAVERNQLKAAFISGSSEEVETYMKEQDFRDLLQDLQPTLECCGLVGAKDWGDQIPDSCECRSSGYGGYQGYDSSGCTYKPEGIRGPDRIYAKSCGKFIFSIVDGDSKGAMGFCFGFAVIALLGLLITIFMIYQVKQNDTDGSIAMWSY